MKKQKKFKIQHVSADQLNDKMLLINLYLTQAIALFIGLIILIFQRRNVISLLALPQDLQFIYWGVGLALIMFGCDLLLSRFINEQSMDDGGINDMLFRMRPIWHIALISFVVAVVEELVFRGAIQHGIGPYWTSILFAVIHIRYLRHWIPTGWVFVSSYGLGYIYIQTGTLWAPILCHFLIDFVSGLVIRFRKDEEANE